MYRMFTSNQGLRMQHVIQMKDMKIILDDKPMQNRCVMQIFIMHMTCICSIQVLKFREFKTTYNIVTLKF